MNHTDSINVPPLIPVGLDRPEIYNSKVIDAMACISRADFLPRNQVHAANEDNPLEIGFGQTISQPFIVAYMSQEARIKPGDTVLEIGTGCGYQAAVLAKLGARVFTIEFIEQLARSAAHRLEQLGFPEVTVRHGDGFLGWPAEAPFDAILITAAAKRVPEKLVSQLKINGRMIMPLADETDQEWLTIITKGESGSYSTEQKFPVRFVPMKGLIEK